MKVLVTGAFGNLGTQTLAALLRRGEHEIRCVDLRTSRNKKKRRQLHRLRPFETVWADIGEPAAIAHAVADRDCILHFAGVIPPHSETHSGLAERVNIEGTRNLIAAAESQPRRPKLVFASSFTVHGNKYTCPPPRHAGEEPEPMDNYTRSKVDGENQLRASRLPWTILRIAAAVPLDLFEWDIMTSLGTMFDVPLAQRIELVHPRDVATAFVNAITADTERKILYVGGGESFQMLFRQYVAAVFDIMGLEPPPDRAFRTPRDDSEFWYTDYIETREGQALLAYQNHGFDEYLREIRRNFKWLRPLVKLLGPLLMPFIVRLSPYSRLP